MKKIAVSVEEETEKKFMDILLIKGYQKNWQILPTNKDIIVDAIDLLYDNLKNTDVNINELSMKKVKKSIGLDEESYNILKKNEQKSRKLSNDYTLQLLSALFEDAIIAFSKKSSIEGTKRAHGKIIKRQTVYISEKVNWIYNKLAFEYQCTLQELANAIIKTAYV